MPPPLLCYAVPHFLCLHPLFPSLQAKLGAMGDLGFKQAMQNKWVALDKSGGGEARVVTKVPAVEDRVHQVLEAISKGQQVRAAGCTG